MDIPLQSWVLFLVALVNLGFVFTVFFRGEKLTSTKLFIAAIFCNVLWAIGDGLFISAHAQNTAELGLQLFFIAPMFTAYFLLLFADRFHSKKTLSKTVSIGLAIPLFALTFFIFKDVGFLVDTVDLQSSGNLFTVHYVHFLLYAAYFSLYFGLSYVLLFLNSKQKQGVEREQIRYILYAAISSSFLALVSNLSLPLLGKSNYIWLGPIFTLFYIVIVFSSIVRHQLFDIRAAVARLLGYTGSIVSLGALYITVVTVLSSTSIVGANLTTFQRIVFATIAVLSGLLFRPFQNFFNKITNKLFYRDAYEPQELIDELNNALVTAADIESLLTKTSMIIRTRLKVESATFYIRETSYFPSRIIGDSHAESNLNAQSMEEILELAPKLSTKIHLYGYESSDVSAKSIDTLLKKNNIEVLGRLVSTLEFQVKGIGMFLLGAKSSGGEYTKQDLKVLEIIANELVIAIENVLRTEEIEQFNVTLQNKIDSATKELKDSNEKLLALDEAKDEFVSMASHQLRTPLTSIKGYLSMVLEGDAGEITDTQKEMLGQAFFSSQRMVYLIADLLNVSRLKTGKFNIEQSPVNLAKVVEEEVSQLQEGAKAKNITLSYKTPKNFPELMLDDMKTRQVIMNFTDNAIYYTPDGGTIKLQVHNRDKVVEFSVTDSGIGVPKEQQHKLFTKFFRADNARKARPDGTGLGLFMAKKVIVSQGGSIIFKSKEGKGSTFGFSFPKANLEVTEKEV